MDKVITYFIMSAMMLSMPSLMSVIGLGDLGSEVVANPNNVNQIAQNIKLQIIPIFYTISYIIGIGLSIRGALALKEYADGPRTYSSNEEKVERPAPPPPMKVNINKEAKDEKIELVNDMFKKPKLDYDFEDKDLNELGIQIQNKVKYLKGHNFLQKDMEALLMVENTEKEYLKSIHQTYIEIPFSKRGNIKMEKSPYSLAYSQLNLLLESLDEIENKIVDHNVMNQRANEIFLKEKLANM